jgi:signal transduction histidine kinase
MDRESFRLVMVNIIGNAINHDTPATLVRIVARAHEPGRVALVVVENEGGPLPDEVHDRVVEPFVTGDSTNTRIQGGLGLGLFVTRRLWRGRGARVLAGPGLTERDDPLASRRGHRFELGMRAQLGQDHLDVVPDGVDGQE